MQKISVVEKIYNWMETFIMDRLVAQDTPGPLFKWLFKIPILEYKLGLGWMTGKYILLLNCKCGTISKVVTENWK